MGAYLLDALASVGAAVAAAAASAPGFPERPPSREQRAETPLLNSNLPFFLTSSQRRVWHGVSGTFASAAFAPRPRLAVDRAGEALCARSGLVELRITILFAREGHLKSRSSAALRLAAVRGTIPNTPKSCLRTWARQTWIAAAWLHDCMAAWLLFARHLCHTSWNTATTETNPEEMQWRCQKV